MIAQSSADNETGDANWYTFEEQKYRIEVQDAIQNKLEKSVHANANRRRLKWHNSQSLTLEGSLKRLQRLYPKYSLEMIEEAVLSWLEDNTGPENCTQEDMDAHTALIDAWIEEYHLANA